MTTCKNTTYCRINKTEIFQVNTHTGDETTFCCPTCGKIYHQVKSPLRTTPEDNQKIIDRLRGVRSACDSMRIDAMVDNIDILIDTFGDNNTFENVLCRIVEKINCRCEKLVG